MTLNSTQTHDRGARRDEGENKPERVDRAEHPDSFDSFDSFDLAPQLLRAIKGAGFTAPRPIQRDAMPSVLDGRDVLGLAQTGTGKTAAFALPILQGILERPQGGARALIVAPTRELAQQIDTEFHLLARHMRLRSVTIYGGVSPRRQIDALRAGVDVIVACPGRFLDLHRQGFIDLRRVETLVLDEADHMFDMGFLPDIRRILSVLPKDRQNLLFSATMPKEIRGLADRILHDPQVVELNSKAPVNTIDHALYPVEERKKTELLNAVLDAPGFASAIVFSRTKHRAKRLAQQLQKRGHRAIALQGNMSQNARDRAMEGFRSRTYDILVATDIAARGIDVAKVTHVINYDVPTTPEAYTHRIGRTGRADCHGKAVTFITDDDRVMVRAIERMIGSAIERRALEDGVERVLEMPRELPRQRGPRSRDAAQDPRGEDRNRNRKRRAPRRPRRTPGSSYGGPARSNDDMNSNRAQGQNASRPQGQNSSRPQGQNSSKPQRQNSSRAQGQNSSRPAATSTPARRRRRRGPRSLGNATGRKA